MQFELSTRDLDATLLAAALRPLDPDARIALDAAVQEGFEALLDPAGTQLKILIDLSR